MAKTGTDRDAALALLGLTAGASRTQITRAYRRLARATHPDVCGDADSGERFVAVAAAYRRAMKAPEDLDAPVDLPASPVWRVGRPPGLAPKVVFVAGPVRVSPFSSPPTSRGQGR